MAELTPEPFANQELPEAAKSPLPVSEALPIAQLESVEVVIVEEPLSITERVKEKAARVADQARYRTSTLYDQTRDRVFMARARAQRRLRDARAQGRHLATEYPVHVVAGIAGAAFLTGMVLRFWRSSRYE